MKIYPALIIALLFICLATSSVFSQELSDGYSANNELSIFSYKSQVSGFLLQQQSVKLKHQEKMATRSEITLQQIGNYNAIHLSSTHVNADIKYYQVGDFNNIENVNAIGDISEEVIQEGNNNAVYSYTYGNVLNDNFKLSQKGDDLLLERFGVNSLSNNIKIKMQGTAKTLVIRSF
ncbi:hypothetical protein [Snuella sedimenti]|uniref:Uncharacterized protein n=1 Tax=Snuella sedimenti TaxID=2798802 RepID=A0A8J7IGU9_9FLAO|nr:hypothetical protein [Snuella sedimenti]MBJ6369587.1 hypothetical protein [Snuella sedimenti]